MTKSINCKATKPSRFLSFHSARVFPLDMNTAVQLWDGQLSLITTPIPHVATPNEVLVKVAFSGICGTDLHILAGEFPSSKCVILGHEFAGVVSEIGSAVKGISVGDR